MSIKVLVICQRREHIPLNLSDTETLYVNNTNKTIMEIITTYLGVSPDDLDFTYISGGGGDLIQGDIVDFKMSFGHNSDTENFIENHRKYFDVVFLNTCPLLRMYDFGPLFKQIMKDTSFFFISAISDTTYAVLGNNSNLMIYYLIRQGFNKEPERLELNPNFKYIRVLSLNEAPDISSSSRGRGSISKSHRRNIRSKRGSKFFHKTRRQLRKKSRSKSCHKKRHYKK